MISRHMALSDVNATEPSQIRFAGNMTIESKVCRNQPTFMFGLCKGLLSIISIIMFTGSRLDLNQK